MHGEAAGEGCGSLSYVCTIVEFTVHQVGFFQSGGLKRLVVSYDEGCGCIYFVVCDKLQLVFRVAATGLDFDDLVNNSFFDFIIIRKLLFANDMFFRCHRLGWGGLVDTGRRRGGSGGGGKQYRKDVHGKIWQIKKGHSTHQPSNYLDQEVMHP